MSIIVYMGAPVAVSSSCGNILFKWSPFCQGSREEIVCFVTLSQLQLCGEFAMHKAVKPGRSMRTDRANLATFHLPKFRNNE